MTDATVEAIARAEKAERERLRCPKLRHKLQTNGIAKNRDRTMYNEWGFGQSKARRAA